MSSRGGAGILGGFCESNRGCTRLCVIGGKLEELGPKIPIVFSGGAGHICRGGGTGSFSQAEVALNQGSTYFSGTGLPGSQEALHHQGQGSQMGAGKSKNCLARAKSVMLNPFLVAERIRGTGAFLWDHL